MKSPILKFLGYNVNNPVTRYQGGYSGQKEGDWYVNYT
jgi:hypothetical protein